MRNEEWRDEETLTDSIDGSEKAAPMPKSNWESMAGYVVSCNDGDGPDPLATGPSGLGCNALLLGHSETQKPRKACQPAKVRHYDVARHWTKRIEPHLGDERLNNILVADFDDYTQSRWDKVFYPGMYPGDIESCDWHLNH
jgi:hypothetical protein